MSDNQQKLTVEQQLLVSAVADELSETTSIHQQVVLRMLAVASEHKLNTANLIQDLGIELKSSTANQLPFVVEDLSSGLPIVESLARTPGVVPASAVIALDAVRSQGLEKPLNQALLNIPNRRKSEHAGAESFHAIDHVAGLAYKFFIVFNVLTFMMLFIIPQFKDMFEEFGVELPLSMQLLIEVCNYTTQRWFIFALFMIGITAFFVWRHPRIFTSYFTRWIPNRWLQPVLSKRARRELTLAWVVQTSDDMPATAKQFISDRGVDSEELTQLAAEEKTETSRSVLDLLTQKQVLSKRTSRIASMATSTETAAWVLRKASKVTESTSRRRSFAGLSIVLWIGNFFLIAIVAWTATAIFQALLYIITGVT